MRGQSLPRLSLISPQFLCVPRISHLAPPPSQPASLVLVFVIFVFAFVIFILHECFILHLRRPPGSELRDLDLDLETCVSSWTLDALREIERNSKAKAKETALLDCPYSIYEDKKRESESERSAAFFLSTAVLSRSARRPCPFYLILITVSFSAWCVCVRALFFLVALFFFVFFFGFGLLVVCRSLLSRLGVAERTTTAFWTLASYRNNKY